MFKIEVNKRIFSFSTLKKTIKENSRKQENRTIYTKSPNPYPKGILKIKYRIINKRYVRRYKYKLSLPFNFLCNIIISVLCFFSIFLLIS